MSAKRATAIAGLSVLVALLGADALAQTKTAVGGMVTLKLSDPGGDAPWRVQRQMLRTFDTMRDCENQKGSFIGFHVGQIERHGLVTASGVSPVIEVENIECFTLRESIEQAHDPTARTGLAAHRDLERGS